MKNLTFKNRTRNFTKNSNGYKFAEMILKGESLRSWEKSKKFRTCYISGSKRFAKYMDYTQDTIDVLEAVGLKINIDFIFGNDAPKGGLTGNYIQLTSKGKRKMIS